MGLAHLFPGGCEQVAVVRFSGIHCDGRALLWEGSLGTGEGTVRQVVGAVWGANTREV